MFLVINILLQLPKQLQGPFIAAVEKGDIRSMPNRTMPALPRPTPGALLMGHPLTGGGMTVALSDIVLLRDMLRPLHSFQDVSSLCDYLQAFYTRRKVSDSILQSIQFLDVLNFNKRCAFLCFGCWMSQIKVPMYTHISSKNVHYQVARTIFLVFSVFLIIIISTHERVFTL